MKDIIYYAIIGGLFFVNVISVVKNRKKDNSVYRIVFLTRHLDWLLAILIIMFFITSAVIIQPYVPFFLKWGLFSLLDKNGTNGNVEVLNQSSKFSIILVILIFGFFALLIPKSAYWEEIQFRYGITKINKKFFISNIKFGLIHCIIGVPIWIGLLLIIIGFMFNLKYIYSYKKNNDLDIALDASTSLHGKYNMLLITLLVLSLTLIKN